MSTQPKDHTRGLKLAITLSAAIGIVLHLAFPELAIDAITLALLVVAVLPWLAPLIKAAELPGGFKIEFQDVKAAADRVAAGAPEVASIAPAPEPSYIAVAEQDPNLALAGLRIEIEKRVRAIAERTGVPRSRPLGQLVRDLEERNVLSHESAAGLRDLITLGNQAAHGVAVNPNVAYSAVEFGPKVLQVLDAKLLSGGPA